jgi:hypothetical protein
MPLQSNEGKQYKTLTCVAKDPLKIQQERKSSTVTPTNFPEADSQALYSRQIRMPFDKWNKGLVNNCSQDIFRVIGFVCP